MPEKRETAACGGCDGTNPDSVQARAGRIAVEKAPLGAVFMGTPDFAAVILRRLLETPFIALRAVYTQPDRPAGRGKKLTPPPVKTLALERGLPVRQPLHFKEDAGGLAARAELAAFSPDLLIVAAYGLILPQAVLDIPRLMPVNVHASLLPKYRGAAPIQRAIMAGEAVTGVSVMRMEAGLDSGPVLMQRAVGIGIDDTSAALHEELAREGADLLVLALERLSAGALHPFPQDASLATYAPKIGKEESLIDFSLPARALHARIRGLTARPGARLRLCREGREPLEVMAEPGRYPLTPAMRETLEAAGGAGPGRIIGLCDGALLAGCGDGAYAFTRLRPAGGKSMDAESFANGYLGAGGERRFSGAEAAAAPEAAPESAGEIVSGR